jgi:hypothetical protein
MHIGKESIEQLKSNYLQLFMDRDLALKFIEYKAREVEELHYQLSLVRSSPLATETPSDSATIIQAGVSVTHDMREEPLVTSSDEGHSKLPILKRSHDSKILDCALKDREPFLLQRTLEAQETIEHPPCGPARKKVYVSMDFVDRYMTSMDTLWDTNTAIISRVLGSIARTGHQMVQGGAGVCGSMQGSSLAYYSRQWSFGAFPPRRPSNKASSTPLI